MQARTSTSSGCVRRLPPSAPCSCRSPSCSRASWDAPTRRRCSSRPWCCSTARCSSSRACCSPTRSFFFFELPLPLTPHPHPHPHPNPNPSPSPNPNPYPHPRPNPNPNPNPNLTQVLFFFELLQLYAMARVRAAPLNSASWVRWLFVCGFSIAAAVSTESKS